jgi:ATP-dependent helicase/nuclease subunit B
MKGHLLLSPAIDMIEFVSNMLLEQNDFSRCLVVFPGKRPGHFIGKYLAQRLNTVFRPPCVLSIDVFIEHLNAEIGISRRAVDAIDSLALIYELNKRSRVIGTNQPEMTLDEFLPWGYKLFRDFEELSIEGIKAESLKTVENLVTEKMPVAISKKLVALSELYTAFYDHIDKNNLTTRAHAYKQVAENLGRAKFTDFDHIYICGFFALTTMERRIFQHLATDDRVQFIFHEGPHIERILHDLDIKPAKQGPAPEPSSIHFYKAMDSHGEIFGLNHVLQEQNDLDQKDVIVIPLPDSLLPILHSTLGFVKEYNISMGYPLHRTPLNTLVAALGRLIENQQDSNYLASDYMRLMLHPYVKNIYLNNASYPTRIMFHTIEEELIKNQKRFVSLKDIEQDEELLNTCLTKLRRFKGKPLDRVKISNHLKMIHDQLVRPFQNIASIADCAEKIMRIISYISQNSPANEHPFTGSFVKTLIEGLHTLQVSDLGREALSLPERYFQFTLNYMESLSHPFPGTPVNGLQVLGFLETRNIKFNRVFLLDVNEGVLPHTIKEDTTLPHVVRKALGLSTIEDQERISRYYFTTLIAGSKQAEIFFVESADKEKSRFVERLIWDIQKKNETLDYPSSEIFFEPDFVQVDPESRPKTKIFADIANQGLSFSASSLNNYLKCPLMYYYQKILGLGKKKEIAEDPDAMGIGGLVHEILMYFFIPKIGETLNIANNDYVKMDMIIDDIFKKKYPDVNRGSVYLIKSQVKRQMKNFLHKHANIPLFLGVKIKRCESVTEKNGLPKEKNGLLKTKITTSDGREFLLTGRIDRVDERNGTYNIIDYKTGSIKDVPDPDKFDLTMRNDWPKTLKSVQLPVYILLYMKDNKKATVNNTDAGLFGLGGDKRDEFQYNSLFEKVSPDERQALFNNYCKAITMLIEEILDMDTPFTMTNDSKTCTYCDFQTICGRQWVKKKW